MNEGELWAQSNAQAADRLASIPDLDLLVTLDEDSTSAWSPVERLAFVCAECDPERGVAELMFGDWLPVDADRDTIEAFLDGVFATA